MQRVRVSGGMGSSSEGKLISPRPPGPVPDTAVFYRLLLEAAKDYGIFSMDSERRITMWGPGAERIFGYKEEEMLGEKADLIFTPEDRAIGAPAAEAREARAKGSGEDERWHVRKNGERFYGSGVMALFRDADGTPIGLVKIVRDLTERKLAQESLRASRDELAQRVAERTRELQEANERLRSELTQRQELLRRISTAQEQERLRIAREMHDQVGQHLAALMLRLNALEPVVAETATRSVLTEAQELTESIGRELHALAVQLRPTVLDDLGLAGAVSTYVELWSSRSGVPVHRHMMNIEDPRLPPELELALYRIVQEAFNNILKHAAATRVSLVINRTPHEVVVVIEDNGRGFAADDLAAAAKNGLGLLGMQERVASLHGRLTIESKPGHGTTVLVRTPLPAR